MRPFGMILGHPYRLLSRLGSSLLGAVLVSFALAAGTPAGTLIPNQATVTFIGADSNPATAVSNPVATVVQAVCGLAVLPNGSAASPAQTVLASPGAVVYLPYLLSNTGNAPNGYSLKTAIDSAMTLPNPSILWDKDGSGRPDAGESLITNLADVPADGSMALLVEVALPESATGDLFVNLMGACAEDAAISDADNISQVIVVQGGFSTPEKIADPAPPARLYAGAEVSYSVTFTANDAPLTDVVIRDRLEPDLNNPTSYSDGLVTDPESGLSAEVEASYENRTLTWHFATLPAGMKVRLELTTTVRADAASDAVVENTACVEASSVAEACAEAVRHGLVPVELLLEKTAESNLVTVGDTLTYRLTASNPSAEVPLERLSLTDTLPESLTYLPGSAVLTLPDGGEERLEPSIERNVLTWSLPPLAPGQREEVRFEAKVTATALDLLELVNTAQLAALNASGESVARSADSVATPLDPGIFRASAVLMGRAYLDQNGDDTFDDGLDTPVGGLRLYLSNGLSTVTDAFGRYTFLDLEPGLLALKVDPTTLPPNPFAATVSEDKPGLWPVRLYPGLIVRQDIPFEAVSAETPAPEPEQPSGAEVSAQASERARDGVVILSPQDGLVIRDRDSLTVNVEAPLQGQVRLTLNGREVLARQLGERVYDEGRGRLGLEFVGLELQPGPNLIEVVGTNAEGRVLEDEITVYFAGPPARVSVTPVGKLVADSAGPLAFDIEVQDAWGKPPLDGFLTVEVEGGNPAIPDADPQGLGFQVRVVEGRAQLMLEPLPNPARIVVNVVLGHEKLEHAFIVGSNLRPWVVSGVGSVGAAYEPGAGFRFGLSGSVFARGAVFDDYLLTFGARYPLGRLGSADTAETFPIPGSSGSVFAEAGSRQGVFARLERDLSHLQYGDFVTDFYGSLFGFSRGYTGLSGHYETEAGLAVTGYAAYVATTSEVNDLDLPADGTSFYRLPDAPIEEGSLRAAIVKKDAFDERVILERLELIPGIDFTADASIGAIQLARPLPLTDERGNPYALRVSYRLPGLEAAPRRLQFGVQAAYDLGVLKPRLGVAQETRGSAFTRVVAAGAALELGALQGDLELAYGANEAAGGFGISASLGYDDGAFSAEGRYQLLERDYRSMNVRESSSTGSSFGVKAGYRLSDAFAVSASAEGKQTLEDEVYRWGVRAEALGAYQGKGTLSDDGEVLGSDPRVQFGLEHDGGLRLALGIGLRDLGGVVGLEGSVLHRQGFGETHSLTDFSLRYQLLDDLNLRLTERLEWGSSSALLVGLEGGFDNAELFGLPGRTTAIAQYELTGGLSAEAGRLRLGVTSLYPLSDAVSLEASLEQVFDLADGDETATVVATSASHQSEKEDGDLRYEARFGGGVKHLLTAGTTFAVSDDLFGGITAVYLSDTGQAARQGLTFSVAGAYRGEGFDLLGSYQAAFGNLAPEARAELSGDVRVAAPLNTGWDFRAGYLYRYLEGVGFQDMLSLGSTAYLWEGGSVTPSLRLFHDWTTGDLVLGAGLEFSQRLGCGLYGVAGYSLGGLGEPLGPGYGGPGFYLRADVVFDEEFRCTGGR